MNIFNTAVLWEAIKVVILLAGLLLALMLLLAIITVIIDQIFGGKP